MQNETARKLRAPYWQWPAHKRSRILILAIFLRPSFLSAQNPPVAPSSLTEAPKAFVERCSGCHGADANGSDRGPALAGSRRLSTRSIQQLRDMIRNGIPGTGMPAFDLPAQELDALAILVHSLNALAAESNVVRRQAVRDRRRHQRDPAHAHRVRAVCRDDVTPHFTGALRAGPTAASARAPRAARP